MAKRKPKDKDKRKVYFDFMGKVWSINADKFKELDDFIEEHDYVPNVEDPYWGTKMLKGRPANVRIRGIEPDYRRRGA